MELPTSSGARTCVQRKRLGVGRFHSFPTCHNVPQGDITRPGKRATSGIPAAIAHRNGEQHTHKRLLLLMMMTMVITPFAFRADNKLVHLSALEITIYFVLHSLAASFLPFRRGCVEERACRFDQLKPLSINGKQSRPTEMCAIHLVLSVSFRSLPLQALCGCVCVSKW